MPRQPRISCAVCGKKTSPRWYSTESIVEEIRQCFHTNVETTSSVCSTCRRVCTKYTKGEVKESARAHAPLLKKDSDAINLQRGSKIDFKIAKMVHIFDLGDRNLGQIFSHLPLKDITATSLVCRTFDRVMSSASHWMNRSISTFQIKDNLAKEAETSSPNWRALYKMMANESERAIDSLGCGNENMVAMENAVFRRLYQQNVRDNIVLVKGKRGRPITLQRVQKPEVASSEAAPSTVRKRRQTEEQFALVSLNVRYVLNYWLGLTLTWPWFSLINKILKPLWK